MKTFEDALDILRVAAESNGEPDKLAVANTADIARDVITLGGIEYVASIARIMLSDDDVTEDQILSFGVTLFTSGVRVGQEMEK